MGKSTPEKNRIHQQEFRDRKKKEGYVWRGFWIKPAWKPAILKFIELLKGETK